MTKRIFAIQPDENKLITDFINKGLPIISLSLGSATGAVAGTLIAPGPGTVAGAASGAAISVGIEEIFKQIFLPSFGM